jgi:hypothetical protein
MRAFAVYAMVIDSMMPAFAGLIANHHQRGGVSSVRISL